VSTAQASTTHRVGSGGAAPFSSRRRRISSWCCRAATFRSSSEDNSTVNACATYCPPPPGKGQPFQFPLSKDCSGIGCCSAAIPKGYTYSIQVQPPGNVSEFDAKSSVYIAEEGSYNVTRLIFETITTLPVLLDWVISNSTCSKKLPTTPASACRSSSSSCQNYTSFAYSGHRCHCSAGYQGNPYVVIGCQGIQVELTWFYLLAYGVTMGITRFDLMTAWCLELPFSNWEPPFPLISQRKYNQSESRTTKARKARGNRRK
jgi:hypothetical protein